MRSSTVRRSGTTGIAYRKVRPARGHETSRIQGVATPLSIRVFDEALGIPTHKWGYVVARAREVVAADAAAEVVRLLNGGVAIAGDEGDAPISPATSPSCAALAARSNRFAPS